MANASHADAVKTDDGNLSRMTPKPNGMRPDCSIMAQSRGPTVRPVPAYPADVPRTLEIRPKPVFAMLDAAVADHAERPCTLFQGRTLTYRDIGARVDEATAGLQSLGVKKGDRVGLLLPNTPTYVIYYFAILKAGAIVVNFNPLYTVEELDEQARDCSLKAMVTLDLSVLFDKVEALIERGAVPRAIVAEFAALLPTAKAVLYRLAKAKDIAHPARSAVAHKIVLDADLRATGHEIQPIAVDPLHDIAVLQYTGGTTGSPKGAMLSHANLTANVQQLEAWAPGLTPGNEKMFGALPFFHVFAMTVVLNLAIARAAEIVIMPRFILLDALKLIHRTRPTVMPGVPTLFKAMCEHPDIAKYDLSSLKLCISGGDALPMPVKLQFEEMTGCKLVEGYGLTETSPVASCNPLDGQARDGSIGLALPNTDISLRALDDPSVEVAQGEAGELCIAGPQVMLGYWQQPEATANTFVGAYLRTGDVAEVDADGYYRIVDRIKDLIICSGFNVYPRRIERAIQAHPAVDDAAVIGIPDDYRGHAPKAFVKLKSGEHLSEDELMAHLRIKLSKIELPAVIEFRDSLPATFLGKASKKDLRKDEAAQSDEPASPT